MELFLIIVYRHAWKHSKKDFLVLLTTMTIVFVFNTGLGLAVGESFLAFWFSFV